MRRVAVTGFGVVSPIGVGRRAFWDSLRRGASGIGRITRFDCDTFDVRLAGEVKEKLDLPEEVSRVAADDPKVGFAFAACAEALAGAGVERLGAGALLHLGASLEIFLPEKALHAGRLDLRSVVRRSLDGRPDTSFKVPLDTASRLVCGAWGRPSMVLTNCSACAASAQAIGHGFRSIRSGATDLAVCGGFDSMVNPLGVGGFQMLGALTDDNDRGPAACRPFDAARRGTVLGEGAAVLVLEPRDRALAEGKAVLAEVSGFGSTLDAHGLSAPDPEGDGAARAMVGALEDAGLRPADVSHVSSHGTGTRLNDEVEAAAIRRVFDGCWERIPVSSVKSVTGHLVAAAGALEAGACLMTLVEGVVPHNPSLETVGQGCELNHVVGAPGRFEGDYALTNSFGFGGQNAALVLRRHDGAG